MSGKSLTSTKDDAVDDKKGEEDAKRTIELWEEGFRKHLDDGDECRDDDDVTWGFDFFWDELSQKRDDHVRRNENESEEKTHAESGLE